jgi:hypothetical protein
LSITAWLAILATVMVLPVPGGPTSMMVKLS